MDFDELDEDDVFWTGDFARNKTQSFNERAFASRSTFGKREEKFGILAALTDESKFQTLRKKPLLSSPSAVRNALAIPKREVPERTPKFNFSAPVKVPMMSKEMMRTNARRNMAFFDVQDDEGEGGGEDEMLPPHEIVARGSASRPNTAFSMLEGAGRTLKGRDLRQVRNAVFRQTGFVD